VEARDGREAVELFRARRPDLVLLDLYMPEQDGFETLRVLRGEFPASRIIAISAGWNVPNLEVSGELAEVDILELAKHAGADHVLEKPLDPDVLSAAVAAVLSGAPAA
jgi:CheY-like chemotaxis protein